MEARNKNKWVLNELASKDDYKSWRYKLARELFESGLAEFVEALCKNPKAFERMPGGSCYGDLKYREWGATSGRVGYPSPKQVVDFVTLGQAVRASLRGKAMEYAMESSAKNLIDVMRVLDEQWGEVSAVDEHALHEEFLTIKWDPSKISLGDWILQKHSIASRIPGIIPPGKVLNRHMLQVMTSRLPDRFGPLCGDIRCKPPSDWREAQKRLVDFEKATQMAKIEPSGATFTAKANWSDGRVKGKGKGKQGFRGRGQGKQGFSNKNKGSACFNCNKDGHWARDCRMPKKSQDEKRWNNKNNGENDVSGKSHKRKAKLAKVRMQAKLYRELNGDK
jgi:hypothetical protein